MTARLDTRLIELKAQKRAGLVAFLMAGDPGEAESLAALKSLPQAGADIIELGMPFSDPMADGPVIEAAAHRALKTGMNLKRLLGLVKSFRAEDSATPIILMGYFNPIEQYGVADFCRDAKEAGVDGLIIVDVPPEEEQDIEPHLNGLQWIRLIAPTTDETRLPKLLKNAGGFVYYISVTGITGAAAASEDALKQAVARIRKHTDLPVAVGFGIKTRDDVQRAAKHADLVVVGSAIVDAMVKAAAGGVSAPRAAAVKVRELALRAA